MTVKLKSAKQSTEIQGVKMLVYGQAGVGKTVLCSTAPEPVILSTERGLLSLRKIIKDTDKDLPYIEINTLKDLFEAYEWVAKSDEARKFKTICLDSITDIAEVILESEKGKTKDPRKAYGETQDQVLNLLRKFRDLSSQHIYFSCQMERVKSSVGETTEIYYQPMMPGQKLAPKLPYMFDEIFAMFIGVNPTNGEKYRALRTQADIYYDAKDRSGMLDELEYPNLSNIINKIMKG